MNGTRLCVLRFTAVDVLSDEVKGSWLLRAGWVRGGKWLKLQGGKQSLCVACLCEVRDIMCVRARVCVVSVCVGMSCQLPQSVSFLQ